MGKSKDRGKSANSKCLIYNIIFGDQKRAIAKKPRKMGLEPVIQGVDPSGPVNGGANDNHVVPFPSPDFQKKKRKRKMKKQKQTNKKQENEEQYRKIPKISLQRPSLPADVLWGSFVTHSFLPHGRGYQRPFLRGLRCIQRIEAY